MNRQMSRVRHRQIERDRQTTGGSAACSGRVHVLQGKRTPRCRRLRQTEEFFHCPPVPPKLMMTTTLICLRCTCTRGAKEDIPLCCGSFAAGDYSAAVQELEGLGHQFLRRQAKEKTNVTVPRKRKKENFPPHLCWLSAFSGPPSRLLQSDGE